MAKEHVIQTRDLSTGKDVNLDWNNGYVYDKAGNQIAKWSPAESNHREEGHTALCADHAADMASNIMRRAVGSGLQGKAVLDSDDGGHLIKMDLGTADVHLPHALPNFVGGYRNNGPIADIAAPPILVAKPADKYFVFSQNDAFQLAEPIIGAAAGQADEISPRLSNFTFTTQEYAIGGFVASQIDAAADAPLRIKQATTKRCLSALMMRRESRVATLLTTAASWNANNVVTLGAGFQWNGGASSDPIKDIHGRIEASLGPVTGMIMNEQLFHAFQRNTNVQKYFTYKNGAQALPSASQMSSILELPPIYVGRMKNYAVAGGALGYTWPGACVLLTQPDQMPPTSQDDIMSACTFRWNATNVPDGSASGGFLVREFFNQIRGTMGGSQIVLLHHDTEVMTSQYVGGLILSAIQ